MTERKSGTVYAAARDLLVVRAYTYQQVTIAVRIDYVKGQITLVEAKDGYGGPTEFKDKKWHFAERELEYMAGWQMILDAIKYAVGEATKELEAEKERKLHKTVDLYMALGDTLEQKGKKAKK